jgi:asparagine synthase (glutamine-hydrolysing)
MYRYMILAWNASDHAQSAVANEIALRRQFLSEDWACPVDVPGLVVLHAGVRLGQLETLPFHGNAGAVLGTVFSRQTMEDHRPGAKANFDESESAAIVATQGRRLLERYWGRYVAVIHDSARRSVRVLRDPSGMLPCFLTTHRGVRIFFSNIEDCLELDLLSFSLNWKFIAARLAHPFAQDRDTGLNEVTEVQAGECVEIQGDTLSRLMLWNPAAVAKSEPIEDPVKAAAMLAETTRMCVHAWASRHGSIVHNLSGGLDSSIVLSCLADAPNGPRVTCLNYFTPDAEGDERRYARLVADAKHCALVEREVDAGSVPLRDILSICRTPKPGSYLYDIQHNRFESELAAERGAGALFTGAGGDALFFQARAELGAADFVRNHGVRASLLRVAHDAARIERQAIWPILLRAVSPFRSKSPLEREIDQARRGSLVNREIVDSIGGGRADLPHPWLQSAGDLPPGKRWHLLSMGNVPAFYDALGRRNQPEKVFPLLSQPLVELCLRIPTYVLIDGGRDRALARRAFAGTLPPEVVGRRTKGSADPHMRRLLRSNIEFVRETLLEGTLVQRRILSRPKLEASLQDFSLETPACNEIMQECLSVEAWVARWQSATRPGAVARRISSSTSLCAIES